jgi:hypothetical protein
MRGFERVVALPDPKKCVLPSRINSLEVQTNLFHDPDGIKRNYLPQIPDASKVILCG